FLIYILFFLLHTAPTKIYTLSLHDALPIYFAGVDRHRRQRLDQLDERSGAATPARALFRCPQHDHQRDCYGEYLARGPRARLLRSEEHTSELQSRSDLVCRLLLEKKKNHTR